MYYIFIYIYIYIYIMCTCVRYGKETGNNVRRGNISLLPWLY